MLIVTTFRLARVRFSKSGLHKHEQTYVFQADLRYKGQANHVSLGIDLDTLKVDGLDHLRRCLDAEHRKLFTYALSLDVEVVNLRVLAEEAKVKLPVKRLSKAGSADPSEALISTRVMMVFDGEKYENCPLWDRSGLLQDHVLHGPCVVSEMGLNYCDSSRVQGRD